MFLVVKKKSLLITIILLLIAATSVTVGLAVFARTPAYSAVVVLDAGHGGIDHGVIGGKTKVSESEINLLVTQKVALRLKEQGIRVVLTRTTAEGLYDAPTASYKQQDMLARKNIILEARPDLVVSIHCNKFPSASRRGGQAFYNQNSAEGKALAHSMQANLNLLNTRTVGREFSALSGDYYILNCSTYPSTIVECGFLSNPEDEALLVTDEYQNEVAYAIFCGVIGFLSTPS